MRVHWWEGVSSIQWGVESDSSVGFLAQLLLGAFGLVGPSETDGANWDTGEAFTKGLEDGGPGGIWTLLGGGAVSVLRLS